MNPHWNLKIATFYKITARKYQKINIYKFKFMIKFGMTEFKFKNNWL